jgi:hypothetical protein
MVDRTSTVAEDELMRSFLVLVLEVLLLGAAYAAPAPDAEAGAIKQTALDYIEGWYEGDAARMARALSPELVKRIIVTENGASRIENMGASKLVSNVRQGGGTKTPKAQQQKDVTILDRFENAAAVKIVAEGWIDYLHVAKIDGRWLIVNVLWERKPKPPEAK